jgi:hypothetical protein
MKIRRPNKNENKPTGLIKILKEREVSCVELDLEVDNNTFHKIAKAGLIEIKRDKQALFNYALLKSLEEFCGRKSN